LEYANVNFIKNGLINSTRSRPWRNSVGVAQSRGWISKQPCFHFLLRQEMFLVSEKSIPFLGQTRGYSRLSPGIKRPKLRPA